MTKLLSWVSVTLFLVVGVSALNTTISYTPDSARYLAWAKSLAFLEGLQDDTGPEISRYVVRPPLYPLLLAPAARFFPYNVVAAKLITLLIGVCAGIIFLRWLRESAEPRAYGIGILLWFASPMVVVYSTQVLTEIPFLLCVVACLSLLHLISTRTEPNPWRDRLLMLSLVAALSIREAGLFLMLAVFVFYWLRNGKRQAVRMVLIPLAFYALWVVRNEFFVAGIDAESGSNVNVLFARLYTTEEVSFFRELALRAWNNITTYAELAGKLTLTSGFISGPVMFLSGGMREWFSGVAGLVFQLAAVALVVAGVFRAKLNHNPLLMPMAVFTIAYSASLLVFPVTDTRYLFPLLPVLLYYTVLGIEYFAQTVESPRRFTNPRAGKYVVAGLAVFLLVPNSAWMVQFVSHNLQYRTARNEHFVSADTSDKLPAIYRRAFDLAGEWIARNAQPESILASRWKEAALWSDNKIVEVTPEATQEMFDMLLRDYNIGYLVSVNEGGLLDLELHMALSRRFSFVPVYRAADVEVFAVQSKTTTSVDSAAPGVRNDFRSGLRLLSAANFTQADSLLQSVVLQTGNHSLALFSLGVAREFAGRYAEAEQLFDILSQRGQAGSMLQQAAYHREMIAKMRSVDSNPVQILGAASLQEVATRCRSLGFTRRANELLAMSLAKDSTFFPALLFRAVYAWEDGDLALARSSLQSALRVVNTNAQAHSMMNVVHYSDSLRHLTRSKKDLAARTQFRLAIVKALLEVGTRERAIDVLRSALDEDPNNLEALELLADLYLSKRMYALARTALSRILSLNPSDPKARAFLEKLEN